MGRRCPPPLEQPLKWACAGLVLRRCERSDAWALQSAGCVFGRALFAAAFVHALSFIFECQMRPEHTFVCCSPRVLGSWGEAGRLGMMSKLLCHANPTMASEGGVLILYKQFALYVGLPFGRGVANR